ncbi:MAG: serine aminopeptidase domain-containing protein, partial [Candidatus Thorarchaeota archaeon]
TFKEGERITLPVFYQQAGNDKLISPERSKDFFESIASKDKTFRMYDGLYHELHEEPEKDMVLADMYSWLQKRLPS